MTAQAGAVPLRQAAFPQAAQGMEGETVTRPMMDGMPLSSGQTYPGQYASTASPNMQKKANPFAMTFDGYPLNF